jgi:hypothetical protein
MTYRIIVINQTAQESHIQIHDLNKDNLDTFMKQFNASGLLLNLELVNADLNIDDCHNLGLFLKSFRLKNLNLKQSKLSVEASVALYSHLDTKENVVSYCFSSAKSYYLKANQFYNNTHPYCAFYFRHAKAFQEVGEKIAKSLTCYNSSSQAVGGDENNQLNVPSP